MSISNESAMRVGTAVRLLRMERLLSIKQLANAAHLSPMQLSRVERLQSSPTEDTIRRLADALDVPIAVLFGDKPTSPRNDPGRIVESIAEQLDQHLEQLIIRAADARRVLRPIESPAMASNRARRERALNTLKGQ